MLYKEIIQHASDEFRKWYKKNCAHEFGTKAPKNNTTKNKNKNNTMKNNTDFLNTNVLK